VNLRLKRRVVGWLRNGGHTQRWLAQEIRVSPSYVAMILSGRRTPSLPVAKRLQDLTGIPATDFIRPRAA
jgi:transcriptional regulator with XRE-family HTH domain